MELLCPPCTSSLETCIDWHPLHCLSPPVHILMSTLTLLSLTLAVAGPRSLSFADPPASRSFMSSADSPSIQHAHSHSAFGHIAVSLVASLAPLFVLSHPSSCLTPQHSHPFTCNPYIVKIIDPHSQKRPALSAERTSSLTLAPPLTHLVVPSAFALSSSFSFFTKGFERRGGRVKTK